MLLPIDIHTHLDSPQIGERQIINSAHPGDWSRIADLARQHPDHIIPSYGLHPWHLREAPPDWLPTLEKFLLTFPLSLLGETGLDAAHAHTLPLSEQLPYFQSQWRLAQRLNRQVTIHCVKAWHLLLPLLKDATAPFLCHAYKASPEITLHLLQKDAYFSFGARELSTSRGRNTLALLPADRYILESDGASPALLTESLQLTAAHLNTPLETLIRQSTRNAFRFLNLKPPLA